MDRTPIKTDKKHIHLNLHAKWFDMIYSGQKKHEYRADSEYWNKRVTKWRNYEDYDYWFWLEQDYEIEKYLDTLIFSNGYSHNRRQFEIELKQLVKGHGLQIWGAPADECFIFILGKVLQSNF